MDNLSAGCIVGGNPSKKRPASDYYPTPKEVTTALLDFLDLPRNIRIWEPACGDNDMVDVMRERGHIVFASDIRAGVDFLQEPLFPCDWIITNPPFSIADRFIERCLEHGKPFALLLKSQYWHAQKRLGLFRKHPPTYVCPLTWRPDFNFKSGEKGHPLMDVMWVVWSKGDTRYIPLERPHKEESGNA